MLALDENKENGETTCDVYVEITGDDPEGQVVFKRTVHINVHNYQQSGADEFLVSRFPVKGDMDVITGKEAAELVDRYMPKKIREYFYFDGERLLNYLTNTESTVSKIRDSIYEIAGVNFINRASEHLSEIVKQFQKKVSDMSPSKKDANTIYYCYDDTTTKEIKHIYLGQKVMVDTTVSVTYYIDTNNTVTKTISTQADALPAAPAAVKEGFTLLGWKLNTTADSDVLPEYVITGNTAVKLYAVFKKDITIEMDPMDAEVPEGAEEPSTETTLYYNNGNATTDEVTMPECPYTTEGKVFGAWTTNPTATEGTYIPYEKYKFTGAVTLYPTFIEPEMEFNVGTSYQRYLVRASGIYEFELWGAQGGDAECTPTGGEKITAKGGKGGYVKVYKKVKKGSYIYFTIGQKPSSVSVSGTCYGGMGKSYGSNTGSQGGGATSVSIDYSYNPNDPARNSSSTQSNLYNNRGKAVAVAGGGGGGGIVGNTAEGIHEGGYAGGEKGQNGSGGALAGEQTAHSYNEYDGFGGIYTYTSGNYAFSGGGCGWFGGSPGQDGQSGAGGSSYVMNSPTFTFRGVRYKTANQANKNEGHGHIHVKFMVPCAVE